MKPKPKYSIGDKVWCVDYSKVLRLEIRGIFQMGKNEFRYFAQSEDLEFPKQVESYGFKKESDFFTSKEELINSL